MYNFMEPKAHRGLQLAPGHITLYLLEAEFKYNFVYKWKLYSFYHLYLRHLQNIHTQFNFANLMTNVKLLYESSDMSLTIIP